MAQGRENRSRRFLWELAAITVVALGLRLVVCAELQDLPSVRTPWIGTDMATYRRLAMDLLAGKLPDAFYYQPFYYAVFLPAVYASLGSGAWSIVPGTFRRRCPSRTGPRCGSEPWRAMRPPLSRCPAL